MREHIPTKLTEEFETIYKLNLKKRRIKHNRLKQ